MRGWTCRTPGCEVNGARSPERTFCSICLAPLRRMTRREEILYFIRNPEVIGDPACPLIHRWTLINFGKPREGRDDKTGMKLLLHHFLPNTDDRHLHDHPRPFFTLILRGGYEDRAACPVCGGVKEKGTVLTMNGWETYYVTCPGCSDGTVLNEQMKPGMLRLRPARHRHRTRVFEDGCWSLVLMGPVEREWGFWVDGSWLDWRSYGDRFGFGMRCE